MTIIIKNEVEKVKHDTIEPILLVNVSAKQLEQNEYFKEDSEIIDFDTLKLLNIVAYQSPVKYSLINQIDFICAKRTLIQSVIFN